MSVNYLISNSSFLSYGATMAVIPGPLQVPEPIEDQNEIIDRENSFIYKDVGSDGYRVFVSVVPTYPHTKRGRYRNREPKNFNRKGMRQKGMRQKGYLKQPGGSSCVQRRH
jgi:hypothetical protein